MTAKFRSSVVSICKIIEMVISNNTSCYSLKDININTSRNNSKSIVSEIIRTNYIWWQINKILVEQEMG